MPKNSKGREVAEVVPGKCIGCQLCIGECPTNVITMEDGVAVIEAEGCIGCGKCVDVCPVEGAILFEKQRKKKAPKAAVACPIEEYKGVAVFIEVQNGRGAEVSWELMGKARELAQKLDTRVFGFLPGYNIKSVAKEAIAYGCDIVYTLDDPLLETYLSKVYGKALAHLCQQVKPDILLLGATPLGRDVSSVVATQLGTGLTADCTGLDIDPECRLLMMTRPTFGGSIMATILCRNHRPQMSTVRPRVMKLPEKDMQRRGEIKKLGFEAARDSLPQVLEFIPRTAEAGEVDITRAPVLVVVGKGACDSKSLPMLEELAHLLGGTIACSRAVIEAGLLPYPRQVGQTGKTVAPKIYIGVGVSGAVQHLVGIQGSDKIIAINTDSQAPLMQIADYAIVGDYQQVVPRLIEGIKVRTEKEASKG
ncbi:MAG TPA: 4Fe-4S dicluster domain-containing protein [Dehalococcoidia bacterium]|nr:4Fe-4S dicluster domain-containing protein [Dehalococcoidia bacterium]